MGVDLKVLLKDPSKKYLTYYITVYLPPYSYLIYFNSIFDLALCQSFPRLPRPSDLGPPMDEASSPRCHTQDAAVHALRSTREEDNREEKHLRDLRAGWRWSGWRWWSWWWWRRRKKKKRRRKKRRRKKKTTVTRSSRGWFWSSQYSP